MASTLITYGIISNVEYYSGYYYGLSQADTAGDINTTRVMRSADGISWSQYGSSISTTSKPRNANIAIVSGIIYYTLQHISGGFLGRFDTATATLLENTATPASIDYKCAIFSDGTNLMAVTFGSYTTMGQTYKRIAYSRSAGGAWSALTNFSNASFSENFIFWTYDSLNNNVHVVILGNGSYYFYRINLISGTHTTYTHSGPYLTLKGMSGNQVSNVRYAIGITTTNTPIHKITFSSGNISVTTFRQMPTLPGQGDFNNGGVYFDSANNLLHVGLIRVYNVNPRVVYFIYARHDGASWSNYEYTNETLTLYSAVGSNYIDNINILFRNASSSEIDALFNFTHVVTTDGSYESGHLLNNYQFGVSGLSFSSSLTLSGFSFASSFSITEYQPSFSAALTLSGFLFSSNLKTIHMVGYNGIQFNSSLYAKQIDYRLLYFTAEFDNGIIKGSPKIINFTIRRYIDPFGAGIVESIRLKIGKESIVISDYLNGTVNIYKTYQASESIICSGILTSYSEGEDYYLVEINNYSMFQNTSSVIILKQFYVHTDSSGVRIRLEPIFELQPYSHVKVDGVTLEIYNVVIFISSTNRFMEIS